MARFPVKENKCQDPEGLTSYPQGSRRHSDGETPGDMKLDPPGPGRILKLARLGSS